MFGTNLVGARLLKKMNYKEFFKITHPILAASMNQVSDTNLAIACHRAGIMPSISVYTYSPYNGDLNYQELESELKKFQDITGTNKIIVTVSISHMLSLPFLNLAKNCKIEYIETVADDEKFPSEYSKEIYFELKRASVKFIPKVISSLTVNPMLMDAVIFKKKEGAGRSFDSIDGDKEIQEIRNKFPSLPLIVSGGISTSCQIKSYLNQGCIAVAIGTLFAAAEESRLSKETKLKMIESSYRDITRLSNGAKQNALIFKELSDKDDFNNTNSLIKGIHDPSTGHVFAGKGIDNIKSIRPIADIVQELVEGI